MGRRIRRGRSGRCGPHAPARGYFPHHELRAPGALRLAGARRIRGPLRRHDPRSGAGLPAVVGPRVQAPALASARVSPEGLRGPGGGRHPVGYLTRSIYALHDRERVEVFGYTLAGDDGSDNFRTIAAGCDEMIDARLLSLEQLAARIAADSIDVLVDLNGYTRGGRTH